MKEKEFIYCKKCGNKIEDYIEQNNSNKQKICSKCIKKEWNTAYSIDNMMRLI